MRSSYSTRGRVIFLLPHLSIIIVGAILFFSGYPAFATDFTWDIGDTGGAGGTGTWDTTTANCETTTGAVNNVVWGNTTSDKAIFGGTAGTVTLSGALTANALTFNTNGYTVTGGTSLTLGGTSPTITVTNANDVATISTVLAGTGGLNIAGAGITYLKPGNTFTGNISVSGGATLRVDAMSTGTGTADSATTALGAAGTRTINLNNGTFSFVVNGTLVQYDPAATTKTFTFGAAGGTFDIGTGATLLLNDGNQFGGSVSWSGMVTKVGAGTLIIGQSGTGYTAWDGGTFVQNGGITRIRNANSFGDTTGGKATIILTSGTLSLQNNSGTTFGNNVTVNGDAAITTDRESSGTGQAHVLGVLTLGANTLTINNGNSATLTFTGANVSANGTITGTAPITISGTGLNDGGVPTTLNKSNTGSITLSAAATSFDASTLSLGAGTRAIFSSESGVGNGSITLAGAGAIVDTRTNSGGTFNLAANLITLTASAELRTSKSTASGTAVTSNFEALSMGAQTLTIQGTGAFNMANEAVNFNVASLTLTGDPTFTVNNQGTGLGTLTIGTYNDGGLGRTITKNGDGVLAFTAALAPTTGTVVNVADGSLNFGYDNAFGNATLNANGASTTAVGQIDIGSTVTTVGAATLNISANNVLNVQSSTPGILTRGGNLTLAANAVVAGNFANINTLGTAADLMLGVQGTIPSLTNTIGAGTPFAGLSSTRFAGTIQGGTINVAAGTVAIALQSLDGQILTLGNGPGTGISLTTGLPLAVNVSLGTLTLNGDTNNFTGVTFNANTGGTVNLAQANALSSGAMAAALAVSGGTVNASAAGAINANNPVTMSSGTMNVTATGAIAAGATINATGGTINLTTTGANAGTINSSLTNVVSLSAADVNTGAIVASGHAPIANTTSGKILISNTSALNAGTLTLNSGGVLEISNLATGLTGAGAIVHGAGSVIRVTGNAGGLTGTQLPASAIVADEVVQVGVDNVTNLSNTGTGAILEIFNGNRILTGSANLTLNGQVLTNDGTARTLSNGTNSIVVTAPNSFTIAATTGATLTVAESLTGTGTVGFGSNNTYDGLAKLGTVVLSSTTNTVSNLNLNTAITLQALQPGSLGTSSTMVNLSTGTLQLRTDSASPNFAANITVSGDTTINVDRAGTGGSATTFSLGTLNIGANQLTVSGGNSRELAFTGNVTLSGNATFNTANTSPSGRLTLSGAISDGGGGFGFTKTGAGAMIISGASANTFTGLVTVNRSTLTLSKTAGLDAIGSGGLNIDASGGAATVTLTAANQINNSGPVTINASVSGNAALLDLASFSETLGNLTMTSVTGSGAILRTGASGTLTLNGNITFNANRDSTGNNGREVLITGTGSQGTAGPGGTLDLNGTRTITVNTNNTQADSDATIENNILNGSIIKEGTRELRLGGTGVGVTLGTLTINAGGVRLLGATNAISTGTTINGTGYLRLTTATNVQSNALLGSPITVNDDGLVRVDVADTAVRNVDQPILVNAPLTGSNRSIHVIRTSGSATVTTNLNDIRIGNGGVLAVDEENSSVTAKLTLFGNGSVVQKATLSDDINVTSIDVNSPGMSTWTLTAGNTTTGINTLDTDILGAIGQGVTLDIKDANIDLEQGSSLHAQATININTTGMGTLDILAGTAGGAGNITAGTINLGGGRTVRAFVDQNAAAPSLVNTIGANIVLAAGETGTLSSDNVVASANDGYVRFTNVTLGAGANLSLVTSADSKIAADVTLLGNATVSFNDGDNRTHLGNVTDGGAGYTLTIDGANEVRFFGTVSGTANVLVKNTSNVFFVNRATETNLGSPVPNLNGRTWTLDTGSGTTRVDSGPGTGTFNLLTVGTGQLQFNNFNNGGVWGTGINVNLGNGRAVRFNVNEDPSLTFTNQFDGAINVVAGQTGTITSDRATDSTMNGIVYTTNVTTGAGSTLRLVSNNDQILRTAVINATAGNVTLDTAGYAAASANASDRTFVEGLNAGANDISIAGAQTLRVVGPITGNNLTVGTTTTTGKLALDVGSSLALTGTITIGNAANDRSGELHINANVGGTVPALNVNGLGSLVFNPLASITFNTSVTNNGQVVVTGAGTSVDLGTQVLTSTGTVSMTPTAGLGHAVLFAANDTTTPLVGRTSVLSPLANRGNSTVLGAGTEFTELNRTHAYVGEFNAGAGGTFVFGENFDDNVTLLIDGNSVLTANGYNVPQTGSVTLSAGWHAFELRFGQGTGGVGPVNAGGFNWLTGGFGFGYDPTGTATDATQSNFIEMADNGTMNLFRHTTDSRGQLRIQAGASLSAAGVTNHQTVNLTGDLAALTLTGAALSDTQYLLSNGNTTLTVGTGGLTTPNLHVTGTGTLTLAGTGAVTVNGSTVFGSGVGVAVSNSSLSLAPSVGATSAVGAIAPTITVSPGSLLTVDATNNDPFSDDTTSTQRVNVVNQSDLIGGGFQVMASGAGVNVGTVTGTGSTVLSNNVVVTADRVEQTGSNGLILHGTALQNAGRLNIRATATPSGNANMISYVGQLAIDNNGNPLLTRSYYATLDLNNNDLIVNNLNPTNDNDSALSQLQNVTAMIRSGRAGNGGLASTYSGSPEAPLSNGQTALGVIRNVIDPVHEFGVSNPSNVALYSQFDGVTLAGNETLVKYTYYGDFNLDGEVTSYDFALLDAGFAGTKQYDNLPGWFFGDADLNNVIDSNDYALLAAGYIGYQNNSFSALPEPSTLGLAVLGCSGLVAAYRRRRHPGQ